MSPTAPKQPPYIVFFDGGCLLCHRAVRWVLRRDREKKLHFATLDSHAAEQYLPGEPRADGEGPAWESMVFLTPLGSYTHSQAVFEMLKELRTVWTFLRIFRIFPTSWTDVLYRWIAARRYKWFGRSNHCPLMEEPAYKDRFLD